MVQTMRRDSGVTRGGICVIVAIVLVLVSITVPPLLSSQRASNERTAAACLKTVASAEADFKANDRDKNGVNDFWTADVKGLYTMTAARHLPLELITRSLAAADADGTFYPAGGENLPLSQFAVPAPSTGYWFLALATDRSASGSEMTYRQDTGGKPAMGSVHHRSKFGFAAFPDSPSFGTRLFIVNEDNCIFRHAPRKTVVRTGKDIPPGPKGLRDFYQHWPDDKGIRKISLLCCSECHCPECGYAGEHDP
jgi:hypothetical protein